MQIDELQQMIDKCQAAIRDIKNQEVRQKTQERAMLEQFLIQEYPDLDTESLDEVNWVKAGVKLQTLMEEWGKMHDERQGVHYQNTNSQQAGTTPKSKPGIPVKTQVSHIRQPTLEEAHLSTPEKPAVVSAQTSARPHSGQAPTIEVPNCGPGSRIVDPGFKPWLTTAEQNRAGFQNLPTTQYSLPRQEGQDKKYQNAVKFGDIL